MILTGKYQGHKSMTIEETQSSDENSEKKLFKLSLFLEEQM